MFKKFKKLGEGAFPVKPVVESTCPSMITHDDKEKLIELVNLVKKKDMEVSKEECVIAVANINSI